MRAIAQLLVGKALVLVPLGPVGGLHGSAARRGDIGFARGAGLRCGLVSRARRSVPQMGPWPGPGMGLLRRGMEVGRPRPRMGVEAAQWLPSRLLARPLGPLPRHALSWASPKRRLAIGGPLHSNWADGSLVAARPPSPLPRARDVGRWRKVAGGGSIRGLRLA